MEKIFKTPELLLPALAEFIVEKASAAIQRHGRFSFVLSGGSSPKKLYELLASESFRQKIAWDKVYFFFGDERYVPQDHADSNFLMVKNSLFDPLKIAADHIFAMNTTMTPEESAKDYQQKIVDFFKGAVARFDFILLGLGDNYHTASLFPNTPVLHEKSALVIGLYIPEVTMNRITLTAPVINLSDTIVFLVYGAGKADAVFHILKSPSNIDIYPAQLIHPDKGDLIWFLDEASAAKIL